MTESLQEEKTTEGITGMPVRVTSRRQDKDKTNTTCKINRSHQKKTCVIKKSSQDNESSVYTHVSNNINILGPESVKEIKEPEAKSKCKK